MPQAGFPLISQPLKGDIPAPLIYLFISLIIIDYLFHSSSNRASPPPPTTLHLLLCYKRHWGRGLGDFLCTIGLYRQCLVKLSPSPRTLFRRDSYALAAFLLPLLHARALWHLGHNATARVFRQRPTPPLDSRGTGARLPQASTRPFSSPKMLQ